MEVKESIDLENAVISVMDKTIIKISVKEHSLLEVKDIKKFQDAKKTLIGDNKHCVLFVTPKTGTLTKEAREFSASPEVNVNAIAKAIVAVNLGMRIVTNFFIAINKPPVLHRAFSNEKAALDWLKRIQRSKL